MAIKIQTTRNVHVEGIKIVVYGSSGVGKTILCSTAPKPIIISAERGLLSLSQMDIPFIEVKTLQDIQDAYNMVKKDAEYETICIDSLSEISETVLNEHKKDVVDGRQAYMKLLDSMGNMIRNFRDLKGKHVVFIAKAKRIEDEESGTWQMEPYIPGKMLPFQLPYLVDEVLYYDLDKKGNRLLYTKTTRKYIAKDRSGVLDESEVPNLRQIFEKISGTKSS
jgi:hypothetical protein